MNCYLIDPEAREITQLDFDADDYDGKRKLLGCRHCSAIYPAKDVILWLDDEGLLKDPIPALWQIIGYDGVLCGKGLLVGLDWQREGEHTDCRYMPETVASGVTWRPHLEFDGLETTEGEEVHPILGKVATIVTKAKFRPKGR